MTADSEKDSTHCLICNSKVGVSTRNSVRIFNESSSVASEKPLIKLISTVLDTDLNEDTAHSLVICKKCYKLFSEVDDLESRLAEVKLQLLNNYKKTIKIVTNLQHENEDYNDHDYVENAESQNMETSEEHCNAKTDGNVKNDHISKENFKHVEKEMQKRKVDSQEVTVEDNDYQLNLDSPEEEDEEEEEEKEEGKKKGKKSRPLPKGDSIQEQIVSKEDSTYSCLLCPNSSTKFSGCAKTVIAHMKTEHDTRLYICDICGLDFRKRNELSIHLDDHVAKEEGDFQCEICNRIFSNLRLFRIHKRIHYPQVKSWPCETCGKRYSSRNLLEEHINTHTGIRPYVCNTCGKDFASKYTYKAHVKTHEIRPRPFECSQCNKSFLSQQNLNQHERTHNGIKEYVCLQCGKAFGSSHNLETHNIVHTGYKPYICRICNKAFARKAEIRDHERTHTGEKPYQCEFCGATFSQRSNLQSHKRATHYNDKRYKCDSCGKGFKRRRLLDYHIKAVHTGERPYKCEVCSATFVYPEHFKKHMRIHTGEKPYLCEVCGKAFNSRDNRNAHRFIHSDKKPYECLVCGMGFMRKPLLYAHMQAQGHLNDTIVVNQPRLTTENDQPINISQGNVELLMENTDADQIEDTGMYVTELKNVIIQGSDDQIYNEEDVLNISSEENVTAEEVDNLSVDGQIALAETEIMECKEEEDDVETVEEVYSYNDSEEGETIVVPATSSDYREMTNNDKGSVRLVQIRFPSSVGSDGRSWLSLVQNT